MGRSVCDFCGIRIPEADFAKGRAVFVLRRTYCLRCMEQAIRQQRRNPKRNSGKHSGRITSQSKRIDRGPSSGVSRPR